MDVHVTPVSIASPGRAAKCRPGTPAIYQQRQFSSTNTSSDGTRKNLLLTRSSRPSKPQTFNTTKRTGPDNNLLLISRKGSSKPGVFLKVTPNVEQSTALVPNKKVLLYQQIERNKGLSGNAELVNRFNYKV